MAYATEQNMIDRFGEREIIQLTDRLSLGVVDSAVLSSALADADAQIDGYLAGRYRLPLPVVPETLVRIACNIAHYHLFDEEVPEVIEQRYRDAVRFLEHVAKGNISLGVDSAGATAQPTSGADMTSGGRIFSRDDSGFI